MRYRLKASPPGARPWARKTEEYQDRDAAMRRAVELAREGYAVKVYPVYSNGLGREWRGTPLYLEPKAV